MAQPATSGIAMAFASSSSSGTTSAMPYNTKHTGAMSAALKQAPGMLTPPNSVSPNLPAQVARVSLASPPPMHIDGDLDLQDAVDHAAAQDQPPVPLSKGALSGLESSQSITAAMLAKHHLPAIILGHGPVAIRHVMACLTQTVPGFTRIPPAKARRLVVAALESRGGGGVDGDIAFEKIGWGRWDAHRKGDTPDYNAPYRDGKLSPPESDVGSYSTSHHETGFSFSSVRNDPGQESWAGSWAPRSAFGEHLDDMSMAGHEADKMSLDGSSLSVSEDDSMTSDSAGDETEEEDWAAIGPDTLRKASLSTAASTSVRRNYNLISIPGSRFDARRPSAYPSPNLGGALRSPPQSWAAPHYARRPPGAPISPTLGPQMSNNIPTRTDQTSQEREAIEALLRMGSM
ncbi:hypothetical protein AAFC00_004686 [Neodothiora populina]|uniref:Sin3 binding protein n=1 Tax=Neodothiora populina TaxID=2781224 RepID=A0ABR3P2V5_9PEZI